VEIVTFGEGRALVRAPGSAAIVAGSLGPPGRSASDSVAQTAGVRGAPPSGGNLRSARAFVLVGALLQYDILDLDGGPLGSVTSKTGFRLSCTVRDRAGRQLFRVVRSTFGRWIVRQPDGSVIASGRRWLGASTVELRPTGMAVRASRTSLQFQERVVLPTGARAPRSGHCWTLVGAEGGEIAKVTTVGPNFAVEILVDVERTEALVVLAQTLLVALVVAKKPSSGGG
jgi:hypothetical protein